MRLHAGLLWGEEVPASALPSIQRLQVVLPEEVVLETHSYLSPSCFGREQATGDMASLLSARHEQDECEFAIFLAMNFGCWETCFSSDGFAILGMRSRTSKNSECLATLVNVGEFTDLNSMFVA